MFEVCFLFDDGYKRQLMFDKMDGIGMEKNCTI